MSSNNSEEGACNLDIVQSRAMRAFRNGHSMAILGGAGTGKTFLLRHILKEASYSLGPAPYVVACAYSNRAASVLNGRTIHSLFAAPAHWPFQEETLLSFVSKKPSIRQSLLDLRVLVIDEISHMTCGMLDSVDGVLRELAVPSEKASLPFGGRQVVLAGDPFQLEAIPQRLATAEENRQAYYSRPWFLCFGGFGTGVVVNLSRNHRQCGDSHFFSLLSRLRHGKASLGDLDIINKTGSIRTEPDRRSTRLCLRKQEVVTVNEKMLASIPYPSFFHTAEDCLIDSTTPLAVLEELAEKTVHVKIGANVILTIRTGNLLPGHQLTVCGIIPNHQREGIRALRLRDEDNTVYTIYPRRFSSRRRDASIVASRTQFAILPAYAMTVHRSQGLNLQRVSILFQPAEIERWKPSGMVYVALSRCQSLDGLWVRGLTPKHIHVSSSATELVEKAKKLRKHYPSRVIDMESVDSRKLPSSDSLRPRPNKRQRNK